MIDTIFFDVGNVLVKYNRQRGIENLADYFATTPALIEDTLFRGQTAIAYEKGMVITREYLEPLLNELGQEKFDGSDINKCNEGVFEEIHSVTSLLSAFKRMGIRIITLSNTNSFHMNYILKEFPFMQQFDDFVFSHEVGCRKPDEEIYEKSLAKAHTDAANCLFFDDLPENVAAARAAGIHAYLFKDATDILGAVKAHGLEFAD